jgi:DNA modification methylase
LVHNAPNADVIDMHWEYLATFYDPDADYEGQNRIGEPWATSGIWDDIAGANQDEHSAPFRVDIPERFIRLYSGRGDIIYEPFCGSGTTIIAAENEGRACYACEIDPAYVAVILERCSEAGLQTEQIE